MIINFVNKRISKELKQVVRAAAVLTLNSLKQDSNNLELNVSIMDFKEIRQLNKRTRGVDKATDVLSYPNFELEPFDLLDAQDIDHTYGETVLLGDIAICLDQAKIQAEENKVSLEDELVKLTIHSVLHLMGFDHIQDEDYKIMHSQEKKVAAMYRRLKKKEEANV